ncbi:hypothetical protein PILCRDRAFT_88833 [Piloderma croceum F 1598]|uniref:Uncharacterized protein n=1 Tax=Piloderma croceum (strain F 1598) TaxID=765440 RepID=A0A0C3BX76_PILCF|nr:hypothetical protein PILCRDRAFT_88833 [Piloderma croceum F 1598]
MDLCTGELLAKPANGLGEDYEPVFPIGFYTTYREYLTFNISVLDELKAQGFTISSCLTFFRYIQFVFDNAETFNKMLDHMQDVGLHLMYNMQLLQILGRERMTVVWSVPQAFGNAEYWPHVPTGKEWVVQPMGLSHRAVGIVPWIDQTMSDIKSSAPELAQ